ncbi:MAG: hypothetical protein HYT87_09980 [Nitrospirae bacterium]|nr:hypothetical protein [Nitrospirota bacterium]
MSKAKPTAEKAGDEMAAFPGPQDRLFEFAAKGTVTPSEFSRRQAWHFYVNGYKDAADFLVTHAATEGDPRKIGYPILFLYRQHLELALKALIRDCGRMAGRREAFPKTHRIDDLWQICCRLLNEISSGTSNNDEIQQTTRLIAEFSKVDPTSEASRYPEDKDGNPPAVDVEVVLSTVKESVGKLSLLLDCIGTHVNIREDDAF